jgi:hypothetical protein
VGSDRLDEVLAACRAGTELLLETPWAPPAGAGRRTGHPDRAQPLVRVPSLVADRDAAVAALARRGIVVGYLYDPPLDDYAGADFTDVSPAPEGARWFARPNDPCPSWRLSKTKLECAQARSSSRQSGRRPWRSTAPWQSDAPSPIARPWPNGPRSCGRKPAASPPS